jgi:hypothetical protein
MKRNTRLISTIEDLLRAAGKKTCARVDVDDLWRFRAALRDYDKVLADLKGIVSKPTL